MRKHQYPQKNHLKAMYQASELGQLQMYMRRFHNIDDLRQEFEQSDDARLVSTIQKEAEEFHTKHTDDFIVEEQKFRAFEKQFQAEQEQRLLEDMRKIVAILKKFEHEYGK